MHVQIEIATRLPPGTVDFVLIPILVRTHPGERLLKNLGSLGVGVLKHMRVDLQRDRRRSVADSTGDRQYVEATWSEPRLKCSPVRSIGDCKRTLVRAPPSFPVDLADLINKTAKKRTEEDCVVPTEVNKDVWDATQLEFGIRIKERRDMVVNEVNELAEEN
ncbi:MAG TPA: hypothetical protein VGJ20_16010 [Xanthobacteraceae bacterium]